MDGRRVQCVRSLVFHTIGRDNRCRLFSVGVVFFLLLASINISVSLQYIRQSFTILASISKSLYLGIFCPIHSCYADNFEMQLSARRLASLETSERVLDVILL